MSDDSMLSAHPLKGDQRKNVKHLTVMVVVSGNLSHQMALTTMGEKKKMLQDASKKKSST